MVELKEYRIFVDSRKLTNYKSHNLLVQLDREFKNCVDLKLVNISLCNSFYNISDKTDEHRSFFIFDKISSKWFQLMLTPGLYNLETLAQEINSKARIGLGSDSKFNIKFIKSEISNEIKVKFDDENINPALFTRKHAYVV